MVLRLSLQEATACFGSAAATGFIDAHRDDPPVVTIAQVVVLEALRNLAETAFLQEVGKIQKGEVDTLGGSEVDEITGRLVRTSAGVEGVALRLLRTWSQVLHGDHGSEQLDGEQDTSLVIDTMDLVRAFGLLRHALSMRRARQAGSASKPSPSRGTPYPPTLMLRQALASSVFSTSDSLEDARDAVVDILYEQQ